MKRMARIQQTLASQASFEKFGRKSKRELFLDQMNRVVPWSELQGLVEPFYPKPGNGRQPVGLAIMLRTYFLQQWFGFSDPAWRKHSMIRPRCAAFHPSKQRPLAGDPGFAGVDLGRAPAPDETTIPRFRHLLEQHDLCGEMLTTVNRYLETKGILSAARPVFRVALGAEGLDIGGPAILANERFPGSRRGLHDGRHLHSSTVVAYRYCTAIVPKAKNRRKCDAKLAHLPRGDNQCK
jgi:hypothetical protein